MPPKARDYTTRQCDFGQLWALWESHVGRQVARMPQYQRDVAPLIMGEKVQRWRAGGPAEARQKEKEKVAWHAVADMPSARRSSRRGPSHPVRNWCRPLEAALAAWRAEWPSAAEDWRASAPASVLCRRFARVCTPQRPARDEDEEGASEPVSRDARLGGQKAARTLQQEGREMFRRFAHPPHLGGGEDAPIRQEWAPHRLDLDEHRRTL